MLFRSPTTYLDVAHQLRTMEAARAMAKAGKAVVMVLHDLPMALPAADDLAVFGSGRLLLSGKTAEVYESGILDEVFGVTLRRMAKAIIIASSLSVTPRS